MKSAIAAAVIAALYGIPIVVVFFLLRSAFGDSTDLRANLLTGFIGAFFAFLFVRLGDGLMAIFERARESSNALVKIEHSLNVCLPILGDNITLASGMMTDLDQNNSDIPRVIVTTLSPMPFDFGIAISLTNVDLINDLYGFDIGVRKMNASIDTWARGYEELKRSYHADYVGFHDTYLYNVREFVRRDLGLLIVHLKALNEELVKHLATVDLLRSKKPLLSHLITFALSSRYSRALKQKHPARVDAIAKTIQANYRASEERLKGITAKGSRAGDITGT